MIFAWEAPDEIDAEMLAMCGSCHEVYAGESTTDAIQQVEACDCQHDT